MKDYLAGLSPAGKVVTVGALGSVVILVALACLVVGGASGVISLTSELRMLLHSGVKVVAMGTTEAMLGFPAVVIVLVAVGGVAAYRHS